jgi:hypothetical protein
VVDRYANKGLSGDLDFGLKMSRFRFETSAGVPKTKNPRKAARVDTSSPPTTYQTLNISSSKFFLLRTATPPIADRRNPIIPLREIQFHLVNVTPAPIFAGLNGTHDRMFRRVKMFCRVFIF